jgi:hypothetical protein
VIYKIKLKNAEDAVLLDDYVYEWLTTDAYLVRLDFIHGLRRHSGGYVVFQKAWKKAGQGFKTETLYLHKMVAEKYLPPPEDSRMIVTVQNGEKLDCRVENLVYRSRSTVSRQRKTTSTTGYTGVYEENSRFRAVIFVAGKNLHLGMFDTAEEAALAYNKASRDAYGDLAKTNRIKAQK